MQMRYGFTHREESLVRVERAAEQYWQQILGSLRRDAGFEHFGQAVAMMRVQHLHPRMRAAEGQAVRRQHQRFGGQFGKAVDRAQKKLKRIPFRLGWPDADIGADLRQQHVAGDQHA